MQSIVVGKKLGQAAPLLALAIAFSSSATLCASKSFAQEHWLIADTESGGFTMSGSSSESGGVFSSASSSQSGGMYESGSSQQGGGVSESLSASQGGTINENASSSHSRCSCRFMECRYLARIRWHGHAWVGKRGEL
jgi:hypothetical protein